MTQQQNPIFERIRKLLAMADTKRGATEAEAHTAATMVQRILQDNGLTMAEVEAAGGSTGADGKRSKEVADRRALYKWQRDLMASLAENFFCMHLIEEHLKNDGRRLRKSKQHVLIGRFVNVQATVNMYDYLTVAIRRAADEHGYDHRTNEKQHHMFLEGATSRLRDRLADRRREREAEDAKARDEQAKRDRHPGAAPIVGTALVVADVYQSEQDYNTDLNMGLPPGTTAARRAKHAHEQHLMDEKRKQLEAEGYNWVEAWYLASGYEPDRAKKLADDYLAREAKAAGKQRKERAYRESASDRRAWERQSSGAYRDGTRAAENIGLDDQVGHAKTRSIT